MYGIVITVNNTLLQAYFVFTVFCRYRGFFLSFFFTTKSRFVSTWFGESLSMSYF